MALRWLAAGLGAPGWALAASACRMHGISTSACRQASAAAGQLQQPAREQMQYDVCIVGAGPAGLAAAIRFKQVGGGAAAAMAGMCAAVRQHATTHMLIRPSPVNQLI